MLLLFTQLFTAVFTFVPLCPCTLVQIDKELNFTADALIYRIVYSHNIWAVTSYCCLRSYLLQCLPLYPCTLVQTDKELNFTADVLIYRIVYCHNIWVVTALLLFAQFFTAVFTLVLELTNKELNFTADVLIYRTV